MGSTEPRAEFILYKAIVWNRNRRPYTSASPNYGMAHYLLTVEEQTSKNVFYTNHIVEAENEQMVKYHYHRTMKDGLYQDSAYSGNKHLLKSFDGGLMADIYEIKELSDQEQSILSRHLPEWLKV